MEVFFETKHHSPKSLIISITVASFLQWLLYQLLLSVKLGLPAECFAIGQVVVVLLSTPYLTACSYQTESCFADSGIMIAMSSAFVGKHLLTSLVIRLLPILIWILISSVFATIIIGMSLGNALNIFVVLVLFGFTAGAVGMCCVRNFQDNIFGTVLSYSIFLILICGAFIIKPIDRYIEDLQPTFGLILHLNPVIAVCTIFEGMDILRNPLFYEMTPITSQDYSYPPWYMNVFWQIVTGACSFLWTWWLCRPTISVSDRTMLRFC